MIKGKKKKKNPPANAGPTEDLGSIPGSGRSPEGGNGNSLQHSCLESPMDSGACPWLQSMGCKESDTTEHSCSMQTSVG